MKNRSVPSAAVHVLLHWQRMCCIYHNIDLFFTTRRPNKRSSTLQCSVASWRRRSISTTVLEGCRLFYFIVLFQYLQRLTPLVGLDTLFGRTYPQTGIT